MSKKERSYIEQNNEIARLLYNWTKNPYEEFWEDSCRQQNSLTSPFQAPTATMQARPTISHVEVANMTSQIVNLAIDAGDKDNNFNYRFKKRNDNDMQTHKHNLSRQSAASETKLKNYV